MKLTKVSISKLVKVNQQKKALRQTRAIQRQISGKHRQASKHWLSIKVVFLVLVLAGATFEYQLHARINDGAFSSTADVQPIAAKNINADLLLSVLTEEQKRSEMFVSSLEQGPISFDPARYDVVLRRNNELPTTVTTTTTVSSVE